MKISISDTYRLDSDLDIQFGYVLDIESKHKVAPSRTVRWKQYNSSIFSEYVQGLTLRKKKKDAVWYVSHCKASSMRDRIIKGLREYIDIDIFGKCYNHSMP
jgi:hypothetical protein